MRGIDYAWADPKPAPSCLTSSGVGFIMRYFSYDLSKDLTQAELNSAVAGGIAVGVVWETTANRMLGGHGAGVSDAMEADARAEALGMSGIPLYFACDWDAAESQQGKINAYQGELVPITAGITPAAVNAIDGVIAPYAAQLDKQMNEVIGDAPDRKSVV